MDEEDDESARWFAQHERMANDISDDQGCFAWVDLELKDREVEQQFKCRD